MPRVDFYILPEDGSRERFTCDIASKLHRQNLHLHIHTGAPEEARRLDDFMWTYEDISFLPHTLVENDTDTETNTITIGWAGLANTSTEVLINLSENIPGFVDKFDRIVEIVPPDDPCKQQARERYKTYREAGFELHNHNINSAHDLS